MTNTMGRFLVVIPVVVGISCAGSQSPAGANVEDGDCRCQAGSRVDFEPVLGGDSTEYVVTVEAEFGAGVRNFDVPVECSALVGDAPIQASPCLGVDHPTSAGVAAGEVEPPYMVFASLGSGDDERTASLDAVTWAEESSWAEVSVERDGKELFSGRIDLEDAVCEDSCGKITYRRGVVYAK